MMPSGQEHLTLWELLGVVLVVLAVVIAAAAVAGALLAVGAWVYEALR